MSDLLTLQRRLRAALADPRDALIDLGPDAARRIAVHRGTIEAGLTQALRNAYPALARVIGEATFARLARAFAADAPPQRPLLSDYGRDFPAFLATTPTGNQLPYLGDLARVEWVRQEALLAADAPALDPSHFDTSDPDGLAELSLALHPAMRLIRSAFPIFQIWRCNQPDVADTEIGEIDFNTPECVLVSRPLHAVITRKVSPGDAALVTALAGNQKLAAAVEAALATEAELDISRTLAGHFRSGTFLAPDVEPRAR